MRERNAIALWILLALSTLTLFGGMWLYTNWQSSQKVLPPGLTINWQDVGGMTREQALDAIALAYTAPITVYYRDVPTMLLPEMLDMAVDMEATAANLDRVTVAEGGFRGFARYIFAQFRPPAEQPREVVAIILYSRERLDDFLGRLAQKYDRWPQEARYEDGTLSAPQIGAALNITASRPILVQAILAAAPARRQARLVVEVQPITARAVGVLQMAIQDALREPQGTGGVFVRHLTNGLKEVVVNGDVAFSALGTLKLGGVIELFRRLDASPDAATAELIRQALRDNNAEAANQLLAVLGNGDPQAGAEQATDFFRQMNLENTFVAAPYGMPVTPGQLPVIFTPANIRTDVNVGADPYIQTTPVDMGLLWGGIAQGAMDSGSLRAQFAEKITVAECQAVLEPLRDNRSASALGALLPTDLTLAHYRDQSGAAYAEVILVYAAQGPFIIVAYFQTAPDAPQEPVRAAFGKIGQLAYTFFNP